MAEPITFEVRQVDAWLEPDGGWTEMNSFKLGVFTTRAENCKRALTAYLRNSHGIRFINNNTLIYDLGDYIEIVNRKTKMPLICAVRIYPYSHYYG